jgi:hypothetical protein
MKWRIRDLTIKGWNSLVDGGWKSGIRQRIPCLQEWSAQTPIKLRKEKSIHPFRVSNQGGRLAHPGGRADLRPSRISTRAHTRIPDPARLPVIRSQRKRSQPQSKIHNPKSKMVVAAPATDPIDAPIRALGRSPRLGSFSNSSHVVKFQFVFVFWSNHNSRLILCISSHLIRLGSFVTFWSFKRREGDPAMPEHDRRHWPQRIVHLHESRNAFPTTIWQLRSQQGLREQTHSLYAQRPSLLRHAADGEFRAEVSQISAWRFLFRSFQWRAKQWRRPGHLARGEYRAEVGQALAWRFFFRSRRPKKNDSEW